jgi:YbbR domain-containing protein
MNTGFDPDMLKLDFEFLQDSEFDLGLTGFGELELSDLKDDDIVNSYDWDSLEDADKPIDNSVEGLVKITFSVSKEDKESLFSRLGLQKKSTPELIGEALMRLC